jgi:hypothetical protein
MCAGLHGEPSQFGRRALAAFVAEREARRLAEIECEVIPSCA